MKIENGKIWDSVRQRWLVLTPEEWVRQHVVEHLTQRLGIVPHRIGREVLLDAGRRADLVVYDRTARPLMIIECKAQKVALTQEVLEQVARYNMDLGGGVRFLVVTNGQAFHCFEFDAQRKAYHAVTSTTLNNLSLL